MYDNAFMADNFILDYQSTIDKISFIGIRTGDPPDLDFTTFVDWQIYSFNNNYDNSGVVSVIGSLLFSGNAFASQGTVAYPVNPTQAYIEFTIDIPNISINSGQYWVALHADVSGWSGDSDDTSLYWAYGDGDGVWAWTANIWGDGTADEWMNPNPAISNGGQAFSIYGEQILEPTIDAILDFFDESVADVTLFGIGPGRSANGRLNALRNMLEMAGDLINIPDIEGACGQLKAALKKCDGERKPPDFVAGPAASELYTMITELMAELGCE